MTATRAMGDARLRFDSQEDALNFARHCVEDSNRWLAANSLDVVKRYSEGKLEIVLKLSVGSKPSEHDLLFRSIPFGGSEAQTGTGSLQVDAVTADPSPNWREHLVLISNAYFVEGPEQVIPTLVWLERPKERKDLLRNILGPAQSVFKLSSTPSERERCELGICSSRRDSYGVASMIEGSPEIRGGVTGNFGKRRWQGFSELDLVKLLVGSLRIWLDNPSVWFCVNEDLNLPIEVKDVLLCTCEFSP